MINPRLTFFLKFKRNKLDEQKKYLNVYLFLGFVLRTKEQFGIIKFNFYVFFFFLRNKNKKNKKTNFWEKTFFVG